MGMLVELGHSLVPEGIEGVLVAVVQVPKVARS
jgi:hypothetical protein